jgi:WhiB family redox-sensing transcriptional regulator
MTILAEDERLTEAEHAWYHALLSDLDPPTLEELAVRPAWQTLAACRGMGPDLFFPASWDDVAHAEARAICERCGVLQECLGYALADSLSAGIWAGTSERGRRQLRRASA